MSREKFNVFRKRVMNLILATDIAKHAGDLAALNAVIDLHGIKDGQNVETLFDDSVEDKL